VIPLAEANRLKDVVNRAPRARPIAYRLSGERTDLPTGYNDERNPTWGLANDQLYRLPLIGLIANHSLRFGLAGSRADNSTEKYQTIQTLHKTINACENVNVSPRRMALGGIDDVIKGWTVTQAILSEDTRIGLALLYSALCLGMPSSAIQAEALWIETEAINESHCDSDEDGEDQTWRGTFALDFNDQSLFTKQIDIRPDQLETWLPQGVTSGRGVQEDDE
jgi:hypothetical protein